MAGAFLVAASGGWLGPMAGDAFTTIAAAEDDGRVATAKVRDGADLGLVVGHRCEWLRRVSCPATAAA